MIYRGSLRMPRVGSREVDRQGSRLIHDWIAELGSAPRPLPADFAAAIETLNSAQSTQVRQQALLLLAPTTTELSAFPLSQPNLVQRESTRSSRLSTSRHRTVAPRPVASGVWT